MNKWIVIFILLVGYGGWWHYSAAELAQGHDEVFMYSLTTCGYCVEKRRELQSAGSQFTEYFIDEDPARNAELLSKLEQAGFKPKSYGTPILDVHGEMLPNNPPLAKIKEYL